RPLDRREERWKRLGTTPVTKARLARDAWVWRVVREGFAPVEFIAGAASGRTVKLVAERDVPRGMVPVLAGTAGLGWPLNEAPRVEIGGFLVDRFEVTNSEFRAFLEAGGYEDAKY
ncbi:MAG: hypothetical protein LC118_18320, partial [Dehalococcoidia bacterium]|nr:hypothetical protein [Dehalococcoidia bacterium]